MLSKLSMVPEDSKESKEEEASPTHPRINIASEDTSPGGSVLFKKKKKKNARRTSITNKVGGHH